MLALPAGTPVLDGFVQMQFEFIMLVTKMIQEVPWGGLWGSRISRDGRSPSENQDGHAPIPIPEDKGRVPEMWGWGGIAPAGGGMPWGRGPGVLSGRWQNRDLGTVCATKRPVLARGLEV